MSEFTKNISIKNLFYSNYCFNKATKLSWLESIFLSIIIGLYLEKILPSLGICFVLIILEGIPLISVVYPLLFSFVESILVFKITTNYLPTNQGSLIVLFVFFILVEIHKTIGKINSIAMGYAMIVFEEIVIAGILYPFIHKMQLLSILILMCMFLVSCISFCRIIVVALLTIATPYFIYLYGKIYLDSQTNYLFFGITFLYSCTVYLWAYLGNDYIGLYQQRKLKKILDTKENEFPDIKGRMYEKYPVLAGQYQYYQTSVCNNSEERQEFDTDWKHYLIYLESSSSSITFNQFFENQKLYQIRKYKQNPYRANPYHTAKQRKQNPDNSNMTGVQLSGNSYFVGVNDRKSLKKRYHDLLKIYHPDNLNGDSTVSRQIQEEYKSLLNKFKS